MTDKYYTPDITEFKVGFKYEYYSDYAKIWKSYILKLDDYKSTQMSESWFIEEVLELKNIRVKHLDKDDIEELGWLPLPKYSSLDKEGLSFDYLGNDTKNIDFQLYFNNWKFIQIFEFRDLVYQGELKNYNELQKIMKQLNIQKDD